MQEKTMPVKEMVKEKEARGAVEAWDPFRDLRSTPFAGLFEDLFAPMRASLPPPPQAWMPRADIRETEKEYILDVLLPGVRKEDVKVEIKDDVLTLTGERKTEKEEKGRNWLRRESAYGCFHRRFILPEGLHPEDVKAAYKDGVLSLTMRKPAEIKPRGVSVKVE